MQRKAVLSQGLGKDIHSNTCIVEGDIMEEIYNSTVEPLNNGHTFGPGAFCS